MKFITAIIQPHRLDAVKKELETVEVNLMTVTSIARSGRQKNVMEICRGAGRSSGLLNKIRLDITINEGSVEPAIEAIVKGAHIDATGEDRIFVV
ncbi:MAG: transcriptional regulator [Deltaproteobacteria bacterium HGW-Deltaproteobacteria-6]|jgi:nitrogen regulatory protein PII|nr:MAG: transcriptional regulator [Deltaproteobacteria bacterium HGW-Deltaproteobacteria-6]